MKTTAPNLVVIIAAGMGSRLKSDDGPPKPLLPLHGKPLITRVLERFAEAGVREAIIVVGYRADEVEEGTRKSAPKMALTFVKNERYRMSNGLSVLAAKQAVGDRNFYLSMADHIFETSLITSLSTAQIPAGGLVLAVDRKLDQIYDEDDATKVRTRDNRIVAIHKELTEFDAVDTGLFACTPNLFAKIEQAAATRPDGDCSLSDGVKALSETGAAMVHDIGPGRWQDVDTPGAALHAEQTFKE